MALCLVLLGRFSAAGSSCHVPSLVWGLGFGVWGLRFRVYGLGSGVWRLGFTGFKVRVWGFGGKV